MASAVHSSGQGPIIIVGHPLKYEASPLKYGALTLYLVRPTGPLQAPIGSSLDSFRANALYYADF